ncbi:hypothetical protein D1AOALGA4SA_11481 [Olavius algarvensis Delta 1 endosymbiont]|nr:hypothetical protein D1AOALGA4SA_11481 [Olavius algarvensis Delta 1 endosymbiont]
MGNTTIVSKLTSSPPVHPHACGEHTLGWCCNDSQSGSSPRLWGTLGRPTGPMLRDRFIPTPVGNTPNTASAMPVPPVHPHACGEHTRQKWPPVANSGSSPRLWGTLVPVRTEKQRERFIPTPVGNTFS